MPLTQHVDSHLMYEVDWSDWLTSQDYDPGDIVSLTAEVSFGGGEITWTESAGAVQRIWIKDVERGKRTDINATITMPKPDASAPYVTDVYVLEVRGE
jgi:hypothetical protein